MKAISSIMRLAKQYGLHTRTTFPAKIEAFEQIVNSRPRKAMCPKEWESLKERYIFADDIEIGNMIFYGPESDHLWITRDLLSFYSFGDGSHLAYDFESSDINIVWIQCDPPRGCVIADNITEFLLMVLVDVAAYGKSEISKDRLNSNYLRALAVTCFRDRPYSFEHT